MSEEIQSARSQVANLTTIGPPSTRRPEASPNPNVTDLLARIQNDDAAAIETLVHLYQEYALQGLTLDQIAGTMNIPYRLAREIRDMASTMSKQTLKQYCIEQEVVEMQGEYALVRAKLIRIIQDPQSTPDDIIKAARAMAFIRNTRTSYMETVGFYEKNKFVPEDDPFGVKREAEQIWDMLANILQGKPIEEDMLYQDTVYGPNSGERADCERLSRLKQAMNEANYHPEQNCVSDES